MTKYTRYAIALIVLIGIAVYYLSYGNNTEVYDSDADSIAKGKHLFEAQCLSCHGMQDDGFGPPLGGITSLLSKEELMDFIKNPVTIIASGNKRAIAMEERYKRVMPPFSHLKEAEVESILAYIQEQTTTHNITPVILADSSSNAGLTGKLVPPVKQSNIQIVLKEVIQLPQLDETSSLGLSTLRAHPSGDRTLFASDQNGIIYSIKNGKSSVFLNMNNQIENYQSGPGIATGLGSFDFHPDYLNNGLIYISHAETYKSQKADYSIAQDTLQSEVQWVIAEWKMDNVKSSIFKGAHRELIRLHAPTFAHGLQELAFIPNIEKSNPDYGLLYFGYGDGGSNNIHHPELGHHLKSFLGSVMRIDPAGTNSKNGSYGIPESNPYANESDPDIVKEIYANGFRNPHHMSWDATHENRMLVTDIGEANIEEINIIENGGDYGWPNREGEYGIATLQDLKTVFALKDADSDLYKTPFAQYDHTEGNAISGGYVYEGALTPLQNKYVFGDIVTGKLYYTNMDAQVSDTTIYELKIVNKGLETTLKELCNVNRLHLRISYDQITKQLYLITKHDSKIWKVVNAN